MKPQLIAIFILPILVLIYRKIKEWIDK